MAKKQPDLSTTAKTPAELYERADKLQRSRLGRLAKIGLVGDDARVAIDSWKFARAQGVGLSILGWAKEIKEKCLDTVTPHVPTSPEDARKKEYENKAKGVDLAFTSVLSPPASADRRALVRGATPKQYKEILGKMGLDATKVLR